MIQVKVATADGATSNLEDDIAVFNDLGLMCFDWWPKISMDEYEARRVGVVDEPNCTSFLPFQTKAFIFSPEGSAYFSRSRSGLVMSCSVTPPSTWPMAFSRTFAPCDATAMVNVESVQVLISGRV